MSSIALILALSAIIWYVIDRFKVVWSDKPYGKYITTGAAGALGAAMVFGYNLDLICAMGIVTEISIVGKLMTVLAFMCGSSAISEIIARIKGE